MNQRWLRRSKPQAFRIVLACARVGATTWVETAQIRFVQTGCDLLHTAASGIVERVVVQTLEALAGGGDALEHPGDGSGLRPQRGDGEPHLAAFGLKPHRTETFAVEGPAVCGENP